MIRAATLSRLLRDRSGVALMEFAFILPILVLMTLTGAELANYITTRMRVSQLALKLADDAARIGTGSLLSAKTISENDINDLFTGANLQSSDLDLKNKGRVVLSSLEPMANPNTTNKFKIRWQRCYGLQSYTPRYGVAGATNIDGMGPGPTARLATAIDDNATMFVEVFYVYKPLISIGRSPSTTLMEIASMSIRDRRDLSDDTKFADGTTNPNPQHPNGVYKVAGVTPSTCS